MSIAATLATSNYVYTEQDFVIRESERLGWF